VRWQPFKLKPLMDEEVSFEELSNTAKGVLGFIGMERV
jgi:hypothetical protein